MSGSFIAHSYSDVLTKINIVITIITLVFYCNNTQFKMRRDFVSFFVFILVLNYGIRMLYWDEVSSFNGYLGDICIVSMYLMIGSCLEYKFFVTIYNKILRVLTIASLVGYFCYDILIKLPAPVIGETWKYHYFGIFALREGNSIRNSGIFWEPGMFQGFLIFGILLIILKDYKDKIDWFDIILYSVAVLTTASTTGYFLLVLLLMMHILNIIKPKNAHGDSRYLGQVLQWFLIIISVSIAIIALMNEELLYAILSVFPEDVVGKLIDPTNISTNSRTYGMMYDIILSFKYPFGVGRNNMKELWGMMMSEYGIEVIGRTSAWSTAFVYSGVLGGASYVLLWIRACIRFQKGDGVKILYTVLIMAIILNTEPHYATLFFNAVAIMWYRQCNFTDIDYNNEEDTANRLSAVEC